MALDARHRSSIYTKLVPVLGDDDTNALMTALPGSEADEFVTRGILRAEMADLRGELRQEISGVRSDIADLRGELKTDIADLRSELKTDIADLQGGLRADIADLRGEQKTDIADLRGEQKTDIADLRAEMNDRFRKQTVWTTSAIIAALTVNTAIVQAIS